MNPTPKQKKALELIQDYDYFLYGGAMGGGKSYLLRWSLLCLLIAWWDIYKMKSIVTGLFCEDYPALKDRHLSKIEIEFPSLIGTMHSDHKNFGKSFILRPEYGSGVIAMRNLDDPSKYASAEFAAIAVDELTKKKYEIFNFLRTRKRWRGIARTKFIAGTNPASIGHAWVKKLFLLREFDPNEKEQDQFVYLPAKAEDNPHLDDGYIKSLDSLPEKMRRAYKDGDWDIFAGQYFTEWRREINTCEAFPIPDFWTRFLSMDYGYAKESSVHWSALDPFGRVYVYRELYQTGLTYQKLAKKIEEMTPADEREMLVGNMVADPAIFAKKGEDSTEKSGAEQMVDATKDGWLSFRRGNNDRINGWGIMREYMKAVKIGNETTAKLIFFTNCKNAINTIPSLVHDETRPEDVDTDSEDHAGDEIRYLLMDIYETYSKEPKQIKAIVTAQERFENDMKWEKTRREEENNNIDWMSI